VWGEPLANALQHAQRHARIVHLGQAAGAESPLRSADVRGKELTLIGHSNFALTRSEHERAYREVLAELSSGRIEVDYDVYGLDDVAAAWENQRGGKSVVIL
jgi:NADPH:quinone reductase-like Zn-dependent oxidoreductase